MSENSQDENQSTEDLRDEIKAINSSDRKDFKISRLKEIVRIAAVKRHGNLALEALQCISDEKERNLLIADVIESIYLPKQEIAEAKKLAKFLTPDIEIQPLVLIRIALAERNSEEATRIAQKIISPFARNFAYLRIVESFFVEGNKHKALEFSKLIIENARTIYDVKSRSYILRGIAIDLYLANHEKELAQEAAQYIPDEAIRKEVLNKLG